jgi:predicted acetyltransferase
MSDRSAPTEPRYPVRALHEDDWAGFVATDSHAFGITVPDAVAEAEREVHEPGRGLGAFEGSTPVAIATAFSFELTVPGGALPAAGVSWVGVLPTHRRRGLLRALMTRQLQDVHDAGREPLAALWASEPPIYGRFGYGLASRSYALTVPRSAQAITEDAPADPALRLRLVSPEDWRLMQPVYDVAARERPGMLARDERWWRRLVRDTPELREGRSGLRAVVAEDEERVRGYALYATKPDWAPGSQGGTVFVRETMSADAPARAALYRYLFDLDLMGSTTLSNTPVDDPLLFWLRNTRAASPRLSDALYLRLVDVRTALRRRTYATPLDVVLDVRDDLCPWNHARWRLIADDGTEDGAVRCERTDGPPDLELGVRELGAAYLGGTALADLGLAGLVRELTPGALRTASAAFLHTPAPWCPTAF